MKALKQDTTMGTNALAPRRSPPPEQTARRMTAHPQVFVQSGGDHQRSKPTTPLGTLRRHWTLWGFRVMRGATGEDQA